MDSTNALVALLLEHKVFLDGGKINKNVSKMLKTRVWLFDRIITTTGFLQAEHVSIVERLYCIMNQILEQPKCKCCSNIVKYLDNKKQYQLYCSSACANTDVNSTRRATIESRYGNAPMCHPEVKAKGIDTSRRKYGTDYHQQTSEGKQQREATCETKYGVKSVIGTIGRAAFKAKYGVDAPMQIDEVKEQILSTVYEKYGTRHHNQHHMSKQGLEWLNDSTWLNHQHHTNKLTLTEIANICECDTTTVLNYFARHNIENVKFRQSSYERRIVSEIQKTTKVEIITNTKKLIAPYELDIYLPEHNIAIEIHGLYWHADIHSRITPDFHKRKYEMCKARGIRLLSIFEDELIHNFELVIQKIKYILGITSMKTVHARKCTIYEPNSKDKTAFMAQHHIQGADRCTITYGLNFNNEPVAMMSLKRKLNGTWEITRYCSVGKVNGGFTKLLNHAEKNLNVNRFETFADLRWSNGNLYATNGFIESYTIPPTFFYIKGTRRMHRSNYMKCKLAGILPSFDPDLTEFENCNRAGLLRVWDCGKTKFVKECK